MQLILTSPEDIFKEMVIKSKSANRKSISAPGQLSFLHSDDESSSDESIEKPPVKGPVTAKSEESDDDLEASSSTVASLLKMSSQTLSSSKRKAEKRGSSPLRLSDQQLKLIDNYIAGKQKIINDLELFFYQESSQRLRFHPLNFLSSS